MYRNEDVCQAVKMGLSMMAYGCGLFLDSVNIVQYIQ